WDLARATGGDEGLDPELVAACAEWFDDNEAVYRQSGAVGAATEVDADADPQARLLARFGRRP
ncbi:MAG: TIGR03086 family metal-binding protein, partial [Egibacteraceae bacterium]